VQGSLGRRLAIDRHVGRRRVARVIVMRHGEEVFREQQRKRPGAGTEMLCRLMRRGEIK
jgi:hypothetical protein